MDCDCGATTEGKWAAVHNENCASIRFAPRHLDLTGLKHTPDADPHRPRVSVWIDENEIEEGKPLPPLTLSLGALWGQQQRFVSLSPLEARSLAGDLKDLADAVDSLAAGRPA